MQVAKVSTGKVLEHRQAEHRDRVKKIMTRKPGSSVTMDNRPPETVAAIANNPRKISIKMHLSHTREQDNKSMLQRISRILTAPSSINDDDYIKMKKLCGSLAQGGRGKYERMLREEKNRKFFAKLKRIPGVYNAQQWEEDYKHQLANQERFMRQVKYKRPPDFVDPFAIPERSQTSPGGHGRDGKAGPRRPRTTDDSVELTEEEMLMLMAEGDEGLEAIGEEGEEDLEEEEEEEQAAAAADGEGKQARSASHVHRVRAQAQACKGGGKARAGDGPRKLPPIATDKRALRPSSSPVKRTIRSAEGGAKRATSASSTDDMGFENPREREASSARRLSARRGTSPSEGSGAVPIRAWNSDDRADDDSDDDEDDYDDDSPEWGDGFDMKKSLKHRTPQEGLGEHSAPPSAETTPRGSVRLAKHRASVIAHRPAASPNPNPNPKSSASPSSSVSGKRRVSTAHRAELTRMDREVRIYTVEMDTDVASSVAGDSAAEGTSSALSPEALIPGISTFATTPRESECRSFYSARAEIKCWLLLEMKTLLVRVYVPDAFPLIDVQAQISLRELASNKGVTVDNLMTDFKTLDAIAREIISEVELTVEDETAAQAAAAKRKKASTLKGGRSGSGGEEKDDGRVEAKGKPTRRTRLIVHMARKGRRRHRSTAEAFLDEQFMSHLSPPGSSSGGRVRPSGGEDSPYKPRLVEPEPERLEMTRTIRVPVTVMVPSAKALRQLGAQRKPSAQIVTAAASSADSAAVDGPLRRAPSGGGLTTTDPMPAVPESAFESAHVSRRPSFDASTGVLAGSPAGSFVGKKIGGGGGGGGKAEPRASTQFVKQLPKNQKLEALVNVSTIKPGSSATVVDKVSLLITFTEPTRDNFGDKVAIKMGEQVSLTVGLPTIMQTDDELILEFFDNLLEGLYVQHNSTLNETTAHVSFREPPPHA